VRTLLVLACLLPAAASLPASADGDCAERVAGRIQHYYDSVHDLRAAFDQEVHSVTLGDSPLAGSERQSGHVVLAKPGKMRWSYEKPTPSLVVSDGETLWLYDPKTHDAQHMRVEGGYLSGAALQFLMGEGDLLQEFRVSADDCSGRRVRLELVPRSDAGYERLALVADAETGEVFQTEIVDLFGNRTAVTFHDVETNRGVSDDLFRFEPPPDANVIDLAPAK
jgi:outer membrane lipoprotein carrier protein